MTERSYRVRLAVVGSECLAGNPDAERAVFKVLNYWYERNRGQLQLVVTGGAEGIAQIARRIADHLNIPEQVFTPKERRWGGPGGYQATNLALVRHTTHLIRVYCPGATGHGDFWTERRAAQQRTERKVVLRAIGIRCDAHAAAETA